jgi:hypothetical protein
MATPTTTFADELREFLRKKQLTQKEFCQKYDIAKSTFHRLIHNKLDNLRSPTQAKINRLRSLKSWPRAVPKQDEIRKVIRKVATRKGSQPACDCGLLTGEANLGVVCTRCHTPVMAVGAPRKVEPVTEPVVVHRVHTLEEAIKDHPMQEEPSQEQSTGHAEPGPVEPSIEIPEGISGFDALHYITAANQAGEEAARRVLNSRVLRQFVQDAPYVPRNLMLFVTRFPSQMTEKERAVIEALFEREALRFKGLVSGHEVVMDRKTQRYMVAPATDGSTSVVFREKYGKVVNAALETWVSKSIVGRTREEILADGLDLIVVEPDPTGTFALGAWHLRGIIPTNTGNASQERDTEEPLSSKDVLYHVPLVAVAHVQSRAVKAWGQGLLDHFNARRTEPVHQRK